MGVLPLQFKEGDSAKSLGPDGSQTTIDAIVRIDAPAEVEYFRHGGILRMVLRQPLPIIIRTTRNNNWK